MNSIFSIIMGILMVLAIVLGALIGLALVVGAIVGIVLLIVYLVKKNNKKPEPTETKESDKE